MLSPQQLHDSRFCGGLAEAAYRHDDPRSQPGCEDLINPTWLPRGERPESRLGFGARLEKDDGRFDVHLSFRGTDSILDWLQNLFNAFDLTLGGLALAENRHGMGRLHEFFQNQCERAFGDAKRFIENHRDEGDRLIVCGHSLGGAMAVITAAWLATESAVFHPDLVVPLAAPPVGNERFANSYRTYGLDLKTLAWAMDHDPVPQAPLIVRQLCHPTFHYSVAAGRVVRRNIDRPDSLPEFASALEDIQDTIRKLQNGERTPHDIEAYRDALQRV